MASRDGDAEAFRQHAEICKALTDPKRIALLHSLRDGERSVGELADTIGCALPNASQHLTVLRTAGLVEARRSGTVVHYRLAEPGIIEACDVVGRIVRRRSAGRTAVDGAAPGDRPAGHTGGRRRAADPALPRAQR